MKKFLLIMICFILSVVITGCTAVEEKEENGENFSHEITKSYKGDYDIGYYIEGIVKNKKDKDYSYVQIEFVCYDKDGNNLGTALDNTNSLLANQTWKFKATAMISDVNEIDHCDYHNITAW